jgi:hypothetical protein
MSQPRPSFRNLCVTFAIQKPDRSLPYIMKNASKRRISGKFRSLINRKDSKRHAASSESPRIASIWNSRGCPGLQKDVKEFGDRQQVEDRYVQAATLLKEAVKGCQNPWESFDFLDLSGEMEEFNDSQFRDKINTVLTRFKNSINDQTAWEKCGQAVRSVFTALSPFAKSFLLIAKEGQTVIPLCFLLMVRCQC